MKRGEKLTVTISPMSFIYLVVVIGAALLLWYLSGVVVLVLASLIFAAGLDPSVRRLQKMKFPRWLAVTVIYLLVLAVVGYLIVLIAPTLTEQINSLVKTFPAHRDKIEASLVSQPLLLEGFDRVSTSLSGRPEIIVTQVSQVATGIVGSIFGFITFLVLTFYFMLNGREIATALVRYVPHKKNRDKVAQIAKESSIKLGHWIRFQLLMSVIVFVSMYILLTILGVQYALAFSVFAALLQFVPFIGPVIGAVPAGLGALTVSPFTALIVVIFVVVLQMILANVVSPQLFKKAIGVSPVIILIAVLIGFALFGPIGIILAVPVAAVIDVVFDSLGSEYVKEKISEATEG